MSCIQCRKVSARWKEENRPRNMYCGQECQIKYYMIGLKDSNDPNMVGVETCDRIRIRIELRYANKLKTLANLIGDAGTDDYIPLRNVHSGTFRIIYEYLKSSRLCFGESFSDLLFATNYLDYPELLCRLLREWVNKRPFPGEGAPRDLVLLAIYFFDRDPGRLNLGAEITAPFSNFIRSHGIHNWAFPFAAANGNLPAVNLLLLDSTLDPSTHANEAIKNAASKGYLEIVERLMQDKRVDPYQGPHDNALYSAAESGKLKVVAYLAENTHINPDSALHGAAWNGHVKVVDYLLQHPDIDPSSDHNQALQNAAIRGHLAVVKRLLKEPRIDPGAFYDSVIRNAASHGQLGVVELLLNDPRVDPEALSVNPNL